MMKFANNTFATLADPVLSTDTVLLLDTGLGAQFPTLAGTEYFYLTLYRIIDDAEVNEVVRVTGRTGDVLNVERGVDGSAALAWIAGSRCEIRNNAAVFREIVESMGDTGAVLDGILGV